MKMFDEALCQRLLCVVDDIVDTAKVIDRLYDIVDIDCCIGIAIGVRLKDIACLIMCQAAAFYVIGVIGQVNLCSVIDTTL